jgi:hypothetical protein
MFWCNFSCYRNHCTIIQGNDRIIKQKQTKSPVFVTTTSGRNGTTDFRCPPKGTNEYTDETTTAVSKTDDEASFSSSFHDIDQPLPLSLTVFVSLPSPLLSPPSTAQSTTITTSHLELQLKLTVQQHGRNCNTFTYDELSSFDFDLNSRLGIQRLAMLTKGRTLYSMYHSEKEKNQSCALVFGIPLGSIKESLRCDFTNYVMPFTPTMTIITMMMLRMVITIMIIIDTNGGYSNTKGIYYCTL